MTQNVEVAGMPFEEKMSWVSMAVTVVVAGLYFATVLGQVGDVPVADIAYQRSLLIAIGASIVLMIIGAIAMAIGTAVSAEVTGEGSVDDIDSKDERDVSISRRGDGVAFYATSAGALGALALAMLEYEYFWIANVLYLTFVVAALVSDGVKIHAYRWGM